MPKKKTFNKTLAILGYLTRYGSINRHVAATHFEVWNLPLEVHRLKKSGHEIETMGKGKELKYTLPLVAGKYKAKAILSPSV